MTYNAILVLLHDELGEGVTVSFAENFELGLSVSWVDIVGKVVDEEKINNEAGDVVGNWYVVLEREDKFEDRLGTALENATPTMTQRQEKICVLISKNSKTCKQIYKWTSKGTNEWMNINERM